jgi:hypothetical protein
MGPSRVGVSLPVTSGQKQIQFPKRYFVIFRISDNGQSPDLLGRFRVAAGLEVFREHLSMKSVSFVKCKVTTRWLAEIFLTFRVDLCEYES